MCGLHDAYRYYSSPPSLYRVLSKIPFGYYLRARRASSPATGFNFFVPLAWGSGGGGEALLRRKVEDVPRRVLSSCFRRAGNFIRAMDISSFSLPPPIYPSKIQVNPGSTWGGGEKSGYFTRRRASSETEFNGVRQA